MLNDVGDKVQDALWAIEDFATDQYGKLEERAEERFAGRSDRYIMLRLVLHSCSTGASTYIVVTGKNLNIGRSKREVRPLRRTLVAFGLVGQLEVIGLAIVELRRRKFWRQVGAEL